MNKFTSENAGVATAMTLMAGGLGAVLGWAVGLPLFPLTGPALLVSVLVLAGAPLRVVVPLRDMAFLLVGISIGAGLNAQAREAILRWPMAFLTLAVSLGVILLVNRALLCRFFGFDRRAALLASSPGHLSFVVALSASYEADATRIVVIQTIRVLVMTVLVPFALTAFGAEMSAALPVAPVLMNWGAFAGLVVLGGILGPVLKRLKVPAHFLIGGMLISALGHLLELTPGGVHPVLALSGLVVIGTLIGTRFSGITLKQLRQTFLAAFTSTSVTLLLSAAFAIPVAWFLMMPVSHVVVAFAPGGLETMIAMGALLGADAGFVAGCHLGRLLLLPVLLPTLLARSSKGA